MHAFFRLISRFSRDQRGNIAVIFVIALIPILTAVGCAIDYSRASRAMSSMQAALDSAALMVSKDLSQGVITTANIGTTAQGYFSALYTDTEAQSPTVTATYTVANGSLGSTIQLNGSASIKTDFMQIVGLPNMSFNTSSTAAWGSNLLRVALVLDNTGSMNDYNKIGALKTASAEPCHPAFGTRQEQWRRLHLRHSLRNRRQCRQYHGQSQRLLAALGPLGSKW